MKNADFSGKGLIVKKRDCRSEPFQIEKIEKGLVRAGTGSLLATDLAKAIAGEFSGKKYVESREIRDSVIFRLGKKEAGLADRFSKYKKIKEKISEGEPILKERLFVLCGHMGILRSTYGGFEIEVIKETENSFDYSAIFMEAGNSRMTVLIECRNDIIHIILRQ